MTDQKPFSFSLKVVVLDDDGRILLLRRSLSSKGNPGKWEFPGGKIEAGESLDEGLHREVFEETGLNISLDHTIGAAESDLPERKVAYLIMEGRVGPGEVRLSEEHDDYKWVTLPQLRTMDMAEQFKSFAEEYAGTD